MKRFRFVPIAGYVDNITSTIITAYELELRGFGEEEQTQLDALMVGASSYLWDGSCACTMVRLLDGPEPVFEHIDNDILGSNKRYTLTELLQTNATDEVLCEWMRQTRIHDEDHFAQGSITLRCVEGEAADYTKRVEGALESAIRDEEGNWAGEPDGEPEWMVYGRAVLEERAK